MWVLGLLVTVSLRSLLKASLFGMPPPFVPCTRVVRHREVSCWPGAVSVELSSIGASPGWAAQISLQVYFCSSTERVGAVPINTDSIDLHGQRIYQVGSI